MSTQEAAGAPARASGLATGALVAALIWGGGWTLFGLVAGVAEELDLIGVLGHALVPGVLFLTAAAIAWRWRAVGGALLVVAGLATLVSFQWASTPLGIVLLPLLGVLAGLAFLIDRFRRS